MTKLRVVSIDGTTLTGGSAFISGSLLQHTSRALRAAGFPGLLRDVDVFAGTSAGSWNALYLAFHADADAALDGLDEYWEQVLSAFSSGDLAMLVRMLGAGLGGEAVMSTTRLRDFFLDFFGHNTRLGDLPHKVIVPSFQLDNGDPTHRSWKPKIFHNIGPDEPDLDQLVADVAMRSGSPPIFTPIYQGVSQTGSGYIDGGVFANNPTMVALAQLLNNADEDRFELLDKRMRIFSVSNGANQEYVDPKMSGGIADWGYRRWLLNPSDPLILIRLLFQAGSQVVDYQTRTMLGNSGYYRLDPDFARPIMANPRNVARTMETLPRRPGVAEEIASAIEWLTDPKVAWTSAKPEPVVTVKHPQGKHAKAQGAPDAPSAG
jgi:predicted acylesterase/phospholipase RssA